jgi:outer membrane murein-binding lipoprotein Lpp
MSEQRIAKLEGDVAQLKTFVAQLLSDMNRIKAATKIDLPPVPPPPPPKG